MGKIHIDELPLFSTLAVLTVGSASVELISKSSKTKEAFSQKRVLENIVKKAKGRFIVPVSFFADIMRAYVRSSQNGIIIERTGYHIQQSLIKNENNYVDALSIIEKMDVTHAVEDDTLYVAVEARRVGLRDLMESELELPYAKYYTEYWDTPFVERADIKAWAQKGHLYQLSTMADPDTLLHIKDTRKLLDRSFREKQWKEGWTLFEDGSGVTCVKTEFPGVTSKMFQWWFVWHVEEDIRYMLWFPPAHYGISPSLELEEKLKDSQLNIFEKTHGEDVVHLVYESTQIDAMSCAAARPIEWHSISFQNPQMRGFKEEDLTWMEENHCVAICGGTRMLHFFAENEDGTGGTLYTHFWFGMEQDADGTYHPIKGARDESIVQPILNISQHAVKEFAQLAHVLPRIYAEEGEKSAE
ncbi:MAG: hypothetical protein IJ471_03710 [Eubacterium sp.]|nr:hypothetical protein [Eubacterium sp.]